MTGIQQPSLLVSRVLCFKGLIFSSNSVIFCEKPIGGNMLSYEFSQFLERLPHLKTPVTLSVTFQPVDKSRSSEAQPQVLVVVGSKTMSQASPAILGGPAREVLALIQKALYEFIKKADEARKQPPKKALAVEEAEPPSDGQEADLPAGEEERPERERAPEFVSHDDTSEVVPGDGADDAIEVKADTDTQTEAKAESPSNPASEKGAMRTLF